MSQMSTAFFITIFVGVASSAFADPTPPSAPTVGIGVGYDFFYDVDLARPNTTNVRFVASPRFALEGGLSLEAARYETRNGPGDASSSDGHVGFHTRMLFRVGRRGATDLNLMGVAGLSYDRAQEAYGSVNAIRKSTGYHLGYGVEIQRWLGRRVAVTLSGETTLLSAWRGSLEKQGTTSSDEMFRLNLAWEPRVRLMLQLYF